MKESLHARADQNIVAGIEPTGTAPLDTYELATFLTLNPATRIRWGSGTVTITFTLGSPKLADIFALPLSNLDAGATRLTLTNGAGLSQAITIPTMTSTRIPLTAVIDLRIGTPSGATRTSNVWNLVIVGNSVNLQMGGLVWLSEAVSLDRNFRWGPKRTKRYYGVRHINDYGTQYRQNHQTRTEMFIPELDVATDADLVKLEAWYDAGFGAYGNPSFLWPDPDVNEAHLGVWQEIFETKIREHSVFNPVKLEFDILSKGKPV